MHPMANESIGSAADLTDCDAHANSTCYDEELLTSIVVIIVPLFFGIIGILGFMGNSLVVLVVAANPGMRSTTNILIINLAVADLLFVIFCIPFTATDFVLPYWPFGRIWCKVVQYLIVVTACASVYTLVLMSLDRYLAVVHPITSMSVRIERHAFIAILILWIVILICSAPVIVLHDVVYEEFTETGEYQNACHIIAEADWPLYQLTFFLLSYVVPLALICGLYLLMLLRLWRGARVEARGRKVRGLRNITRLVICVVGVFAVCWCPIQVVYVLKSLQLYPQAPLPIIIQIASHVLAYTNSCVNPILYAFLSENFRKAFRKVIYCKSRQEHYQSRMGPATKSTRATSTAGNALL